MDWGLIGTILAIIFGSTTIVLAIRLARRKKPVWAYNTTKIIGLDTGAPPEVKLYFHSKPVNEIFRTNIVFFNKGNETISGDETLGIKDVTENVTIHFKEAKILRQPVIKEKSKEAIRFSAKQVIKDGDNAIELGFRYLDRHDGAIIEVMHTQSQQISHSGNIMGAKIEKISDFEPSQKRPVVIRPAIFSVLIISAISLIFLRAYSGLKIDADILSFIYLFSGALLVMLISDIASHIRFRKFPSWSHLAKQRPPSLPSKS